MEAIWGDATPRRAAERPLLHVDGWTVLDEYAQVTTATDDTARLAHLQAAIAAVGAGLAEGVDYEWIDTDREHTRCRFVKIQTQAAQLLADTDPHQASAYSDAACDLDPRSDELARRAMHAAAAWATPTPSETGWPPCAASSTTLVLSSTPTPNSSP
jgi:hypothetical protein